MMIAMVRGNPNWKKQNSATRRFCVRGENPDGEMVTLGNYEKEREARARYDEYSIGNPDVRNISGEIIIPDYNPEWVSIDVRWDGAIGGGSSVDISGTICHECIPEPAAFLLLAIGSLAVLKRKRKP